MRVIVSSWAFLLLLVQVAPGITFEVTTTLDAGPGSLRQAILSANLTPGLDDIHFDLPGPGPYTITPLSALPMIISPVSIDGSTQPGFAGSPLVHLSGALAGMTANGLWITAGQSSIRALIISGFGNAGVRLETNGNNTISGNLIGRFGGANAGNGVGIQLNKSSGNSLGLPVVGGGNVIAGNTGRGLRLMASSFNSIENNFIGVDVSGSGPLGNASDGIRLEGSSGGNTIGGSGPQAGNVIANSGGYGIILSLSEQNVIEGNLIGTDAFGRSAMPNALCGITFSQAGFNTVGGLHPGSRNLISGNGVHGIEIGGASSANNVVQGNFIGTDATGMRAVPNGSAGIYLGAAPLNVIGGVEPRAGNLISGNTGHGIQIDFAASNSIMANLIGVAADGTLALGNLVGIAMNNASHNTIGLNDPDGRNLIAGNRSHGLSMAGLSEGNVVEGNYVGTDISGSMAVPNRLNGLLLEAANNTIGGMPPGARNVFSGNFGSGIVIRGAAASGNVVQGNFIGTDASGFLAVANLGDGITLQAPSNTIGGTGTDPSDGNLISGNRNAGIFLSTPAAVRNVIQGNFIGVNERGEAALPNEEEGIYLDVGADQTLIGGAENGAGNLVSGNLDDGLEIRSSTNFVQGNIIGADLIGTTPIPNMGDGILITDARENLIGGSDIGLANRIAFNRLGNGVRITGAAAAGNRIVGNSIWANECLGINLDFTGHTQDPVTINDPLDADAGPNRGQNFPVLTNVVCSGTTLVVQGFIQGAANRSLNIDFYANTSFDASGHGEGQRYLSRTTVITDSAGYRQFGIIVPNSVSNEYITATATDAATGDTSEFSAGAGGLRISHVARSGNDVQVSFTTCLGSVYRLEYATELSNSPVWQAVPGGDGVAGTGTNVTVTDVNAPHGNRFYRVLMP